MHYSNCNEMPIRCYEVNSNLKGDAPETRLGCDSGRYKKRGVFDKAL